jgi:lipoprotein-anchoring transpeptidase ErfK/SrfK
VPVLTGLGVDLAPASLRVGATGGTLTALELTGPDGTSVPGTITDGTWAPDAPLAFGTPYQVSATTKASDGAEHTATGEVTTLAPAATLSADVTPYAPERPVGVGMPVILRFDHDIPVEKRAELTSRISVTPSAGPVEGAFRWLSDDEVHFRPKDFWPANTDVRVVVDLAGLDLGAGLWGGESRDVTFRVGNSNVTTVDCDAFTIRTEVNGVEARSGKISCGREDSKAKYVTRSGTHLIGTSAATGNGGPDGALYSPGTTGGYTMDGASVGEDYSTHVDYAMRIADTGEFIHSAPWSVGSQGRRNVSHGCVNASPADAAWLYSISQIGDPVVVTGTERPLEMGNGLGDWAVPFEQYAN